MKSCYLSGPMTGKPNYNYEAFHEAAELVRQQGYEVINPAEAFHGDQSLPYATYMRHDIESLLKVDFVVVLPGWEHSRGALFEVLIAAALGLPVNPIDDLALVFPVGLHREGSSLTPLIPTNETILEEAQRLVGGDRNTAYGHPLEDMTRTGRIWAAILGVESITAEQVALCMIGVKLSRECNAPKRDNRVDAAGYAYCLERIHRRRAGLE